MCCVPDYCYTKIDSRVTHARKTHHCEACDDGIKPGDKYVRTVCLADGGDSNFEHYKHCLRCWSVLRHVRTARPEDSIAWALDCGEDWRDTIGEIPADLLALAFMTRAEVQRLDVDVKSGSYDV
jgi:hypothetical protein